MDAEQYSKLNWKCPECGSTTPSESTSWEFILFAGCGPYCAIQGGCLTPQRMVVVGKEAAAAATPDTVNHPSHYNQTKVECIDVVDDLTATLPPGDGYYVGAIIKYLYRYPMKGGAESLRKARWYLDRLISHVEKREAAKE